MSSACRARGKLTPLRRKLWKLSAASLQLCLAPVWRLSRILTENTPCFVPALGKLSHCKDVLPPRVFLHASFGTVSLSQRCCEKGPLAASASPCFKGVIAHTRSCWCHWLLPGFACEDQAGKVSPLPPWRMLVLHQGGLREGAPLLSAPSNHHLSTRGKVHWNCGHLL